MKIYAERILKIVVNNIKQNDGFFRTSQSRTARINTFDQAWAATLLKIASQKIGGNAGTDLLWYKLRRQREDRWWSDSIKSISLIFAIIVNATNNIDEYKWITALLLALSAFFGGIDVTKKLFQRITGSGK